MSNCLPVIIQFSRCETAPEHSRAGQQAARNDASMIHPTAEHEVPSEYVFGLQTRTFETSLTSNIALFKRKSVFARSPRISNVFF
jgi:hypothetical protein